jgi:hypothetical protein
LKVLGVDVEGANRVAQELINRDKDELLTRYMIYNERQLNVIHAAILSGMIIGIKAERMKK